MWPGTHALSRAEGPSVQAMAYEAGRAEPWAAGLVVLSRQRAAGLVTNVSPQRKSL